MLLRKVLYAGEFLDTLVADDVQRSWFGLICLLAYFTDKERGFFLFDTCIQFTSSIKVFFCEI